MNKDVQATLLSNVLLVLADYSNRSLIDLNSSKEFMLSELVSDSLSVLEIIYELEDKYQITISTERLRRLITVSDLVLALDQELTA